MPCFINSFALIKVGGLQADNHSGLSLPFLFTNILINTSALGPSRIEESFPDEF